MSEDTNTNEGSSSTTGNTSVELEPSVIQLGSSTLRTLNVIKDEWANIREDNKVYINTSNENKSDKLSFTYDPSRKWFQFGKVKQKDDSATDTGKEAYYNVYLKPYIIGEDGSVVEEGTGGGSSSTGGGGSTETQTGLTSIGSGEGIRVDFTIPNVPIISIDNDVVVTNDTVQQIIEDKLENMNIVGGDGTSVDINTPDYNALLELLNVLFVAYEDEAIVTFNSAENFENFSTKDVTGFRYVWIENDKSFNCLRIKKDFTTQNEASSIYLKVIDGGELTQGYDNNDLPYGKTGDAVFTISKNSVSMKTENDWYEWYFPKNIEMKQNHIYAFIPQIDKDYKAGITECKDKISIKVTNDYNSAYEKEIGVWLSTRANDVDKINNKPCTPIFQLCYKNPTTITMIR